MWLTACKCLRDCERALYKSSVFCDLINNNLDRIVRKIQIRNHVKMFKSTLMLVADLSAWCDGARHQL